MTSPTTDTRLLIFTDMDGSLLDHHDYSHAAADPLLGELEAWDTPVIPATSKTAAELIKLRHELANRHPFIAENGAAVFIPQDYFSTRPEATDTRDGFLIKAFSAPRSHWQALIKPLQQTFGDQFTTFADAGIDSIKGDVTQCR